MGAALGSDVTDTFTLSMSYESAPGNVTNGGFGIASIDSDGAWVTNKFVGGPGNRVMAWAPTASMPVRKPRLVG